MKFNQCSDSITIYDSSDKNILGIINYEEVLKEKIHIKFVDKNLLTRAELYKIYYIANIYKKCMNKAKNISLSDNPYKQEDDFTKLSKDIVKNIVLNQDNKNKLKKIINDIYIVKKMSECKQTNIFDYKLQSYKLKR